MNLRIIFYIFCSIMSGCLWVSCLNSDEPQYTEAPIDAQITDFKLSHDSVAALSSAVFSIDQFNNLIFNHDSLAYGTKIEGKVVATFATSAIAVLNITHQESGDSTWVASGDSLDMSSPVHLKVYAYNGTVKYYWAKLNIHQIDPDSIRYWQIANNQQFLNADETKAVYFNQRFYTYSKTGSNLKLYTSNDGASWAEGALSGLPGNISVRDIQVSPTELLVSAADGKLFRSSDAASWQQVTAEYPVKAVLGYLKESLVQAAGWTLVAEKDGKNVFAFYSALQAWAYGTEISTDFPVSGFSSVSSSSVQVERVTVIGGKNQSGNVKNSVWSTTNGLYWGRLTDDNLGLFPLLDGANALLYNESLYLMNGKLSDGAFNQDVYFSIDGGASWSKAPSKCAFPEGYTSRYLASMVVDKNNYLYVVGGKKDNVLTDIWKGILNKLGFGQ